MLMTQNIIDALKKLGIKADSAQLKLIDALSRIRFGQKFTNTFRKLTRDENLGIYIWGDVGRGKTLIAEEYLKQLSDKKNKSFHFIDFMNHVHNELNNNSGLKDPLKYVSKEIINKCNIIFIDEFQVEDVADAMIIADLLEKILDSGTKVIITSNAHPDNLYKDGLQRQKFIKSMQACTKKLEIFNLAGDIDYRTKNIIESANNKKNTFDKKDIIKLIKDNFSSYINHSEEIEINGRKFKCNFSTNNLLWIDFMIFFREPTGSADYKDISSKLDWIFISNFTKCDDNSIDIVRRFITFIDIAYTKKVKVKFFFNNLDINEIYEGTKLDLLWSRCESRLNEMQGRTYFIKDINK